MKRSLPSIGEYVLGTKWSDGDPQDPWAIGFLSEIHETSYVRYFTVTHADGRIIRSGLRKVRKISQDRGKWLLENSRMIEESGRRLGYWLRYPMSKETPRM